MEIDIMKMSLILSWIILIIVIVSVLLSNKINRAVNVDKKLKKVIVVFSFGVLLICTIVVISTVLSYLP